ncbi:hypothetical protein DLAC_02266 [Tieghemostelium lacteum]|uniref:GIY-YIG domain-containing protein n=1 Tax=Tieghemostelium lacteum TaxID=361077 RepID=A0A152A500_TIELA|nr:hypothetical protein DLAC_02266 [Tieghemostelium lacteum]|eukprot:KYR01157.1 hypothetical protein DLAC_02266 [Tieghemostelium lacteum]
MIPKHTYLFIVILLYVLPIKCDKFTTTLQTIPNNWICVNNDFNDIKHIARNRGLPTPAHATLRPNGLPLRNANTQMIFANVGYPTQNAPVPGTNTFAGFRRYIMNFNAVAPPFDVATFTHWNPFPPQPGVYMYFNENGDALYIGESGVNLQDRFRKHDPVHTDPESVNQIINCPDDNNSVGCVVCWRSLAGVGITHNYRSKIIEALLLSTLCSSQNIEGGGDYTRIPLDNVSGQHCVLTPAGTPVNALVYANYIIDNLQTIINNLDLTNNQCF